MKYDETTKTILERSTTNKTFVLYRDKPKVFECNVKVDGANLSKTKARLIINFDDGLSLLYRGVIEQKTGNCQIAIPALKEIPDTDKGHAILEIIAEDTLFESWTAPISVTKFKNVVVEVQDYSEKDNKINVIIERDEDDDYELETQKLAKQRLEKKKLVENDLMIKKKINNHFIKFTKKGQLKEVIKHLEKTNLHPKAITWGKRVFKNETFNSKFFVKLYSKLLK